MNPVRPLLSILLLSIVLWRNLPGALLCLRPAMIRARKGSPEDKAVDAELFDQMEAELAPLGFERIGVHYEKAPLRKEVVSYDFAHPAESTFGSAYRYGKHVRLYLLTALSSGAFVLTADHKRPGREAEGFLAGGIPGATPEQVLAAHRRRVERLKEQGYKLEEQVSSDARVEVANRWFAGAGTSEVRLRHVNALLVSLIGAVLIGAVLIGWIRAA